MHLGLKRLLVNCIGLALVSYFAPGFSYGSNLKSLLLAAIVLGLANLFIRPLLKIIFLPVNLITFGLFSWFINVIILYIVVSLVPHLQVSGFTLNLGQTNLILSPFLAYIFISFLLSLVINLINWVLGD